MSNPKNPEEKKNILIIGAGPAGLACGYELLKHGSKRYCVDIYEQNNQVGGISKTVEFNGYYYDLGGHRFFSKIKYVNDLWEEMLGDELLIRKRLSRIYYNQKFFSYPLKISNAFFNLGLIESILLVLSYIKSKFFPTKEEANFEQWITNRFGKRLFNTFFKTYTEKVWGIPCTEIRAEWAAQRIKNLSFTQAVINALPFRKKTPHIKTLIAEFKYPKLGPGMMYNKISENFDSHSDDFNVIKNTKVTGLKYNNDKWSAVILDTKTNEQTVKEYDEVVSTMPLTSLMLNMNYDVSADVLETARNLRYRNFLICCLVFDKDTDLKDNWIYIHEKTVKLGRVQILKNWSPFMVKNHDYSSIGAEYFCNDGDEIWSMPDKRLIELAISELKKCRLIPEDFNCIQGNVIRVSKAYPVYDEYFSKNINKIIDFVKSLPNLQVAGRYGMFKYNNMDHSIYTGMLAAQNIILGKRKYDNWKVNQDEVYHELKPDNMP